MTTEKYTLLPPNATPLELALEQAMRPLPDALAGAALVASAKEVLPDGWPMWLVWEYGLEELLPYLPDPRAIITTGLQWQRLKGTPASLRMALGWLAMDAARIEQETPTGAHWFEYQIDPGRVPTREELRNIVGLADLSAPVGTRLSRIFHGWDFRRAVWDETRWDDGSLYDDDSGIFDPDLGIDLSFGRTIVDAVELGEVLTPSAITLTIATLAPYVDREIWDFSRWDSGPGVLNYQAGVTITHAVASTGTAPTGQADVSAITRSRDLEEYGWSASVGWGDDRTWAQPAVLPD